MDNILIIAALCMTKYSAARGTSTELYRLVMMLGVSLCLPELPGCHVIGFPAIEGTRRLGSPALAAVRRPISLGFRFNTRQARRQLFHRLSF